MRTVQIVLVLCGIMLLLCGCRENADTDAEFSRPDPPVAGLGDGPGEDAGGLQDGMTLMLADDPNAGIEVRSATGEMIPPCMPWDFAIESYAPMVAGHADLSMNGIDECIIGYQFIEEDSVGEPTEAAYFALIRYDQSLDLWQEWFSIPAPGDERYVDGTSIIEAGDINGDGTAELVLLYHGFGVSSRPETLYVWQIIDGELHDAIARGYIDLTSDDAVAVEDFRSAYPGPEIVLAVADMGDEAHAESHYYNLQAYGWTGSRYDRVHQSRTAEPRVDARSALAEYIDQHGDN